MIRVIISVFILSSSLSGNAESLKKLASDVNDITAMHGKKLDESDRKAVRRRLETILDIYEDAGLSVGSAQFICNGRSIYTKEGVFILNSRDKEQCLLNVKSAKRGSSIFCSGRSAYSTKGTFILNSQDMDQCHLNLKYSAEGADYLCSGRSFYSNSGTFLLNSSNQDQCTTNLKAVASGSELNL